MDSIIWQWHILLLPVHIYLYVFSVNWSNRWWEFYRLISCVMLILVYSDTHSSWAFLNHVQKVSKGLVKYFASLISGSSLHPLANILFCPMHWWSCYLELLCPISNSSVVPDPTTSINRGNYILLFHVFYMIICNFLTCYLLDLESNLFISWLIVFKKFSMIFPTNNYQPYKLLNLLLRFCIRVSKKHIFYFYWDKVVTRGDIWVLLQADSWYLGTCLLANSFTF